MSLDIRTTEYTVNYILKLHERKASHSLLDFIGKTFIVIALPVLEVLKKAITQNIHRESFHNLSKICKSWEGFVNLWFMVSCNNNRNIHNINHMLIDKK